VAVPLPLPNELAPPEGAAPAAVAVLVVLAEPEPAADCGLTG